MGPPTRFSPLKQRLKTHSIGENCCKILPGAILVADLIPNRDWRHR